VTRARITFSSKKKSGKKGHKAAGWRDREVENMFKKIEKKYQNRRT